MKNTVDPPAAEPGFYFICVHGVGGSAAQMADWTGAWGLPPGPVHYLNLSMREKPVAWRAQVDHAVRAAQGHKSRLILIGHSLGGLLCLDAATRHPVDGVIALNAPFRLRTSLFQIRMATRMVCGRAEKDDEVFRAYRIAREMAVANGWKNRCLPKAYWRLLAEIRRVRRHLDAVRCPVLLMQSGRDETVSRHSAARFAVELAGEVAFITLPDSRHAWFKDADLARLRKAIQRWIGRLRRPPRVR